MEHTDEVDTAPDGRVQRACDACRSRKIRCDRRVPCSNCRGSRLTCTTTAPAQKPQRQRVHISDEYEKKIDRIEDRLASIEHVLETLSSKLADLDFTFDHEHRGQSRSNKKSTGPSHSAGSDPHASTPAPFEGETTISRQADFARELLEQTVGSSPSIEKNAEMKAALTSLQEMVVRQGAYANTMTNSTAYPFLNKSLADIDHTQLERPPWDLVSEVIDKAAAYPTMSFVMVFPFLKMPNMKDVFRDAFEAPGACTVGGRMLVFGVLTHLFYEFAYYPVVDKRVESYFSHAQACERQMEVAMSQLDLYIPATYENILALLLGSTHAIGICKPSLCWTMIYTAAQLAQSLGYHRIQTMEDDSEELRDAKIHVFWFIYMMDKTLSLRLGRASTIQDWDMALPYPNIDSDHARFGSLVQQGQKGTEMLLYWIKVAQIQGKAYEELFSPAGKLKPVDDRAHTANKLVAALNQAWSERGEVVKLNFPGSFGHIGGIFHQADVVVHYSTCALIQRAVSPDNVIFDRDCLQSARAALVAHQRCSEQFNVEGNEQLWTGYIHWAILQAPFTPFIVIFCNAVLHCDPSDLNTLSEFVVSLESSRTVSEGADKLYKMCHLFLRVAKLYVETKTKEAATVRRSPSLTTEGGFYRQGTANLTIDMNTMTQFDPYLSALGLLPNSAWPASGYPPIRSETETETLAQGRFDPSISQDWFSGSRYLMNLMEDDIQMPDFNL